MTDFLLDTNVPSELIRPQPEQKVAGWLAAQTLASLFISAVSFGELRKGIVLRAPGKRRAELENWIETDLSALFSARTLSVTRSIAERWGVLDGERQLVGRPLNAADGLIAATALASTDGRRRARAFKTKIGNHTLRATGITDYLKIE